MIDFSKLNEQILEGRTPTSVSCELCGHRWDLPKREAERDDVGVCPKCGAGRWESTGSKMLDALLQLENDELPGRDLEFIESLARQRNVWRGQGFKPDHLPSVKQVTWLKRLYERFC